eukprot:TRINITY_DN5255_c0_g1_i5.p1 TRINITY_DN5255_c0_g1~~TRINITY_DN5255_c0_g1_i5.p1  ORF type:complete len:3858 (+),score=903.15 TRINITY_DN5255_c0_g1_i5:55-11628(+)
MSSIGVTSNINVSVRVRPLNTRERDAGEESCLTLRGNTIGFARGSDVIDLSKSTSSVDSSPSKSRLNLSTGSANADRETFFTFENVYDPECKTSDIYTKSAKELILSCLQGYNATIFAYGQTSSGKTHTMMGHPDDPGVIPLAVKEMFTFAASHRKERDYTFRVSMMELYQDTISDLLQPSRANIKILDDPEKGPYVSGLKEILVADSREVMHVLNEGQGKRHVAATLMNDTSSRSHTIFRMSVESMGLEGTREGGTVKTSQLFLVDLAGSERAKSTGAEGVRLKEGGMINKSLLNLGLVINKLSEGKQSGMIPYRDSKLTRILQSALGGNSKTAIICTVTMASQYADETRSTLLFASRAKKIKNHARINKIEDDKELIKKLKQDIIDMKRRFVLIAWKRALDASRIYSAADGTGDSSGSCYPRSTERTFKDSLLIEFRKVKDFLGSAEESFRLHLNSLGVSTDTSFEVQSTDEQIQHLMNLIEKDQRTSTGLKEKCQDLENETEKAKLIHQSLSKEKEVLEINNASLRTSVAELQAQLHNLSSQLLDANQKLSDSRRELEAFGNERSLIQEENRKLELLLKDSAQRIQSQTALPQDPTDPHTGQFTLASDAALAFQIQFDGLLRRFTDQRSDHHDALLSVDQLQQQVEQLRRDLEAEKIQNKRVQSDYTYLTENITQSKLQITGLQEQIRSMVEVEARRTNEYRALSVEKEILNAGVRDVLGELSISNEAADQPNSETASPDQLSQRRLSRSTDELVKMVSPAQLISNLKQKVQSNLHALQLANQHRRDLKAELDQYHASLLRTDKEHNQNIHDLHVQLRELQVQLEFVQKEKEEVLLELARLRDFELPKLQKSKVEDSVLSLETSADIQQKIMEYMKVLNLESPSQSSESQIDSLTPNAAAPASPSHDQVRQKILDFLRRVTNECQLSHLRLSATQEEAKRMKKDLEVKVVALGKQEAENIQMGIKLASSTRELGREKQLRESIESKEAEMERKIGELERAVQQKTRESEELKNQCDVQHHNVERLLGVVVSCAHQLEGAIAIASAYDKEVTSVLEPVESFESCASYTEYLQKTVNRASEFIDTITQERTDLQNTIRSSKKDHERQISTLEADLKLAVEARRTLEAHTEKSSLALKSTKEENKLWKADAEKYNAISAHLQRYLLGIVDQIAKKIDRLKEACNIPREQPSEDYVGSQKSVAAVETENSPTHVVSIRQADEALQQLFIQVDECLILKRKDRDSLLQVKEEQSRLVKEHGKYRDEVEHLRNLKMLHEAEISETREDLDCCQQKCDLLQSQLLDKSRESLAIRQQLELVQGRLDDIVGLILTELGRIPGIGQLTDLEADFAESENDTEPDPDMLESRVKTAIQKLASTIIDYRQTEANQRYAVELLKLENQRLKEKIQSITTRSLEQQPSYDDDVLASDAEIAKQQQAAYYSRQLEKLEKDIGFLSTVLQTAKTECLKALDLISTVDNHLSSEQSASAADDPVAVVQRIYPAVVSLVSDLKHTRQDVVDHQISSATTQRQIQRQLDDAKIELRRLQEAKSADERALQRMQLDLSNQKEQLIEANGLLVNIRAVRDGMSKSLASANSTLNSFFMSESGASAEQSSPDDSQTNSSESRYLALIQAHEKAVRSACNSYTKMQESCAQSELRVRILETELVSRQKEMERTLNEDMQMRAVCKQLESKVRSLEDQLTEVKGMHEQKVEELEAMRKHHAVVDARLKDNLAHLQAELKSVRQEYSVVNESISLKEQELISVKQASMKDKAELEFLRQQLEKQQKDESEKSLAIQEASLAFRQEFENVSRKLQAAKEDGERARTDFELLCQTIEDIISEAREFVDDDMQDTQTDYTVKITQQLHWYTRRLFQKLKLLDEDLETTRQQLSYSEKRVELLNQKSSQNEYYEDRIKSIQASLQSQRQQYDGERAALQAAVDQERSAKDTLSRLLASSVARLRSKQSLLQLVGNELAGTISDINGIADTDAIQASPKGTPANYGKVFEAALSAFFQAVDHLSGHLQSSISQIDQKSTENKLLRNEAEELIREVDVLKSEASSHSMVLRKAREELRICQERSEQISIELEMEKRGRSLVEVKLEEALRVSKAAQEVQRKQVADLEHFTKSLRDQLAVKTTELDEANRKLQGAMSEHERKCTELQLQKGQTESQYHAAAKRLSELDERFKHKDGEVMKLRKDALQMSDTISLICRKIETTISSLRESTDDLSSADNIMAKLQRLVDGICRISTEQRRRIVEIEESFRVHREQMSDQDRDLSSRILDLEKHCQEADQTLGLQAELVDTLKNQVREATLKRETLKGTVDIAQRSLAAVAEKLARSLQQHLTPSSSGDDLSSQRSTESEQFIQLVHQVDASVVALLSLHRKSEDAVRVSQSKLDVVQGEKQQLFEKAESLVQELGRLRSRQAELEVVNTNLDQENQSHGMSIAQYQSEIAALENEVASLRRKHEECVLELSSVKQNHTEELRTLSLRCAQTVDTLTEELQSSRKLVEEMEADLHSGDARMDEADNQIQAQQQELDLFRSKCSQLQSSLQLKEKACESLERLLFDLKREICQTDQTSYGSGSGSGFASGVGSGFTASYEHVSPIRQRYPPLSSSGKDGYSQKIDEYYSAVASIQEKHTQAALEIRRLNSEVSNLRALLASSQKAAEESGRESKERMALLESEVDKERQERAGLEDEVERLHAQVRELTKTMNAIRTEKEQLLNSIQTGIDRLASVRDAGNSTQISSTRSFSLTNSSPTTRGNLEVKMEGVASMQQQLGAVLVDHLGRLQELQIAVEKTAAERDDLKRTLEKQIESNKRLSRELQSEKHLVGERENEVSRLREQKASMETLLEEHSETIKRSEAKAKRLEESLHLLQEETRIEIENLTRSFRTSKSQVDDLEAELTSVKESNKSLASSFERAESKRRALVDEIDVHRSNLREKDASIADLSLKLQAEKQTSASFRDLLESIGSSVRKLREVHPIPAELQNSHPDQLPDLLGYAFGVYEVKLEELRAQFGECQQMLEESQQDTTKRQAAYEKSLAELKAQLQSTRAKVKEQEDASEQLQRSMRQSLSSTEGLQSAINDASSKLSAAIRSMDADLETDSAFEMEAGVQGNGVSRPRVGRSLSPNSKSRSSHESLEGLVTAVSKAIAKQRSVIQAQKQDLSMVKQQLLEKEGNNTVAVADAEEAKRKLRLSENQLASTQVQLDQKAMQLSLAASQCDEFVQTISKLEEKLQIVTKEASKRNAENTTLKRQHDRLSQIIHSYYEEHVSNCPPEDAFEPSERQENTESAEEQLKEIVSVFREQLTTQSREYAALQTLVQQLQAQSVKRTLLETELEQLSAAYESANAHFEAKQVDLEQRLKDSDQLRRDALSSLYSLTEKLYRKLLDLNLVSTQTNSFNHLSSSSFYASKSIKLPKPELIVQNVMDALESLSNNDEARNMESENYISRIQEQDSIIHQLRSDLATSRRMLQESDRKLEALASQLQEFDGLRQSWDDEVGEHLQVVASLRAQLAEANEQRILSATDAKSKAEVVSRLGKEIEDRNRTCAELQRKLEMAHQEIEKHKDMNDRLKTDYQAQREELTKSSTQFAALQKHLSESQQMASQVSVSRSSLEFEYKRLESRIKLLEEENASLAARLEKLRHIRDKFQAAIFETLDVFANIDSIPLESLQAYSTMTSVQTDHLAKLLIESAREVTREFISLSRKSSATNAELEKTESEKHILNSEVEQYKRKCADLMKRVESEDQSRNEELHGLHQRLRSLLTENNDRQFEMEQSNRVLEKVYRLLFGSCEILGKCLRMDVSSLKAVEQEAGREKYDSIIEYYQGILSVAIGRIQQAFGESDELQVCDSSPC